MQKIKLNEEESKELFLLVNELNSSERIINFLLIKDVSIDTKAFFEYNEKYKTNMQKFVQLREKILKSYFSEQELFNLKKWKLDFMNGYIYYET